MTGTATNQVLTFGCRLNIYESEVIKQAAEAGGLSNSVIINSCAVTKEAERQVQQSIRKTRKTNPKAQIIVTGCAAQIDPQKYNTMPEVDRVIGNSEKMLADSYKNEQPLLVNDIMAIKETASHMINGFDGKARAFLQIQNGCNHRCTFCIIPYGRGNSRSVPFGELVSQVKQLVASDYNEIVLTGVDITDYGKDLPGTPVLGSMIRRLLDAVPELPRLRLSSIDVAEIDNVIFDLIENEPRFMPHIHISLQAGNNMILKRMKRRHSREDIVEFCDKVRHLRSDIAFGADIIAGFPTETDEMFQNTLDLVHEVGLHFLHVFPYSEREGTPAANMPSVPKIIRKERAALLRQAGQKELEAFMQQQIGKSCQVIVEKNNTGHTEHFLPITWKNKDYTPGSLIEMDITAVKDNILQAA